MNDLALFYPEGHDAHFQFGHPESPERVEVIRDALMKSDSWDQYPKLKPQNIPDEILESIHDPEYLEKFYRCSSKGQSLDLDTYTTKASWELAKSAAGGAIAVAKSVWHQEFKRGFALTRPPGHHATSNRGMGFCLLNNIAIAAEYLLQCEGAIRLAIIDLDLHHGNGTQDIFWTRDDVFYASIHQYPHYPGTGNLQEIGGGRGEGKTANFPVPPMSGDEAYESILEDLIIPLVERFCPDMILISYGYDIHWRDPLGQVLVSADGYKRLISKLASWADKNCEGKIALFLEGGYDLEAAAACSLGVVAALLDQDWIDTIGPSPTPGGEAWKHMLTQAKILWSL